MTKTALITGVTGQDGRLLARFLLDKGYDVTGITRMVTGRDLDFLPDGVDVKTGDIRDMHFLTKIISAGNFDEIYHLAAISDVAYSFEHPDEVYSTNIGGTINLLNAIMEFSSTSRVYFAATSEMFGAPGTKPQNEVYPMRPKSPYGVSKLAGYWTSRVYRESYGLNISCGILFNHESTIRGPNFVTRKITLGIAKYLVNGRPFQLGNLDARKDWGWAPDYVRGMWLMLNHREYSEQIIPDDFILATGEQHTVREFLYAALEEAKLNFVVESAGTPRERFVDAVSNAPIVSVSRNLYRPSEADNYMGDFSKAKNMLGWEPTIGFKDLVKLMLKSDIEYVRGLNQ